MDTNAQLDKFSDLPLQLVIMIISYLSLTDAFRLCVMRQDWLCEQLWRNCGSIELHETSFTEVAKRTQYTDIGQGFRANVVKDIGKLRFVHFLNKTLVQIIPQVLSTFKIQMSFDPKYRSYIPLWIAYALAKNVQKLVLDFTDVDPLMKNMQDFSIPQYVLPKVLYDNGEQIRILSLRGCRLSSYYNFYSFERLTVLVMEKVVIATARVTDMLLTCPLLEDLVLVECYNLCKVDICYGLERLKRLVVRHCGPLSEGIELVCLPMLQYFEYAGGFITFEIDGLDELDEVVLDFQIDAYRPRQFEEIKEALFGFMNAMKMTITTTAFKVLPLEYMSNLPLLQFRNLHQLTLMSCMRKYELPGILSLLRSAPNLKSLTIGSVFMWPRVANENDENLELPDGFWTPQGWTLDHIECVRVDGFTGKLEYEMDLVKFLMRNAKNLHKITITPRIGGSPYLYLDVLKDIGSVEFASECLFIECAI